MAEIKTPPITIVVDDEIYEAFGPEHTLSDIARWLMTNRTEAVEMVYLLEEMIRGARD